LVELSTHLLVTQHEIETLQGYMRMVEGQASDLYASDIDA
jgi:hypothetical protein